MPLRRTVSKLPPDDSQDHYEARRFIYMEEKYLVDMETNKALQSALPNIQHLTILIPDGNISDLPQNVSTVNSSLRTPFQIKYGW